MLNTAAFMIFAYLLGSLSSAIIVCKLFNLPDPREQGSGNPGATNVLRIGGKKAAVIVLLGDVLKGAIPVLTAQLYGLPDLNLTLVVFAAFLGHLYPCFFGFKGGKGVATAFGGLIAMSWLVGLAIIATWAIMAAVFRYSSLAALTAAVLAPVYTYFLTDNPGWFVIAAMSLILVIRHRGNIKRLVSGTESKIGKK